MQLHSPVPQSILRKALTYNPSSNFDLSPDDSPGKKRQASIFTNQLSSELSISYPKHQTISINDQPFQNLHSSREYRDPIEEESSSSNNLSNSEEGINASSLLKRNPPPKTKPIMPFRDRILAMEEHANSLQKLREQQKRNENIEINRMEFPELDSIQENGDGQSVLRKPPQMTEEDFKQFELFFPSEQHQVNEQLMEMEKIANTALIPESIQHAYGIRMSVGGSREKKRKKDDKKNFNNKSNDVYIERTNAQGRKIRIRQIGMVNKSSSIGDLSSYLTRDEMKLRAKSLAYAQYRKMRQEESKAKAHRKLMFLLVVVKCKAFATRMKKRIIEKRRLKELSEGKEVVVVEQDFKRRSSVMLSRESSMRSFGAGSFSNQNLIGGRQKSLKVSGSLRDKKFRSMRIMSEEDSVTQGELYYENQTPQLAPSRPDTIVAPSAPNEHQTQMSEHGSKKVFSPEMQRVSSNASTLVEVGKGAKLDIVALKSYLDQLKQQRKQENQIKQGIKLPEIQRLSPGGGSESMLKKFSQSSIGPPPQYMSVQEHSFRADEELTMDIKNIDNFLIGKNE